MKTPSGELDITPQNLVDALQKEIKTNPDYKNYQIDLIKNIYDLRSTTYDLIHYPYFDPFKLTYHVPAIKKSLLLFMT
jgi:hypothetical protein